MKPTTPFLIVAFLLLSSVGFAQGDQQSDKQVEKKNEKKVETRGVFYGDYKPDPNGKIAMAAIYPPRLEFVVFRSNVVHFGDNWDKAKAYEHKNSPKVRRSYKGRYLYRDMNITPFKGYGRIKAVVEFGPVPKEGGGVHDAWDKAGFIALSRPGYPDLEVIKFVTSFGHSNRYEVDVTHLAPILQGEGTFKVHIDTWVNVGHRVSFSLVYEGIAKEFMKPGEKVPEKGHWVFPLFNNQKMNQDTLRDGPREAKVEVPEGLDKVQLYYLASGHGKNEEGAGEFKSRINVVNLNRGWRLLQVAPWRSDGYKHRKINPYSGRWGRGQNQVWSSDFPRSGWMPGNLVEPKVVEVMENLIRPGVHSFQFYVEGVADKENWRVSAYLVGFKESSSPKNE